MITALASPSELAVLAGSTVLFGSVLFLGMLSRREDARLARLADELDHRRHEPASIEPRAVAPTPFDWRRDAPEISDLDPTVAHLARLFDVPVDVILP